MPYQFELYVHREAFFEELQSWFSNSLPEYRLRSLTGAPGIGKSWVVAHTYHELCQAGCIPIWLDLSQDAVFPGNPDPGEEPALFPDARTEVGRQQWLRWAMEQAQKNCSEIVSFDGTISFESMFAQFVEDLCLKCNSHTPVLLVDGYDEVESPDVREYLQEHIFTSFWQPGCTRLLIAHRDAEDDDPHRILSWNEEILPLPGFVEIEQRKQIENLQREHPAHPDVLDTLEPYLSKVPLVNHILFEHAIACHPNLLNATDFQHCVGELVARAGISPESVNVLYIIAQNLDETWTDIELQEGTNIRLEDSNLEQLFDTGLVHHIIDTALYQIDEGVRSLLKHTI